MSVIYLVATSLNAGMAEARSHRDWVQIGYVRFVTPEKHDIRVVCRAAELMPFAGETPMIKGGDYDAGPGGEGPYAESQRAAWVKNREEIDRFAAEGNGKWVDAPP